MTEKTPERKCWEMNETCPMRGQPRAGSTCPAYRKGVSCWEFDWQAFVEALPKEKWDYWKAILEQCEPCLCYRSKLAEMRKRVESVRRLEV